MIAKRLVFLFPGFEPLSAAEHAERFRRGAAKSAETWGVRVELPAAGVEAGSDRLDPHFPALPIVLSAETWRTDTELVICGWGDFVARYADRHPATRIAEGLRSLGDFIITGTFFRYCRVSWRYALFFLFPLLTIVATIGAGILVALLPDMLDWSSWHLWWSLPLGILCSWVLGMLAVRHLHFLTVMDDWAFAYDFCRGRNAELAARIAECRDLIAERSAKSEADEILVVGHSLGASLAVIALAEALAQQPPARLPHVLTVGSSLLKTALHPAAKRQRDAVKALVAEHHLSWVDVQALSDPINFYRSNPALSLGIQDGRTPVVNRISLGKLVAPETYRRIRRNFFRLHRQFMFGVERRRSYSLHMILLGPVAFERYAAAGTIDVPPLKAEKAAAPTAQKQAVAR